MTNKKTEPQKTEAPATPQNKYPLTCVYAGRRLRDGKVYQCFIDANGDSGLFQGVKRVWIGYTYRCAEKTISAKPERVDVERVHNPEWEAQDAVVENELRKRRAEAKLARDSRPALRNAINALAPLCRRMNYFDRRSLIEYLAEMAVKEGKKK